MNKLIFKEAFRWFGPNDKVRLADIRQAGATDVVSALHSIPNGELWSVEEIKKRQREVAAAGLTWSVVESLPVHEEIKRNTGNCPRFIDTYIRSLQNLSLCGIKVVTYNFMPVLDWTRTNLTFTLSNGAKALRFDMIDYVAFDLFVLGRDADGAYPTETVASAKKRFEHYTEADIHAISNNIFAGLPGAEQHFDLESFRAQLALYKAIDASALRQYLIQFLETVAPAAEELGMVLALHPDDPPFSLFGLPRVVSTAADYRAIFDAVPILANGMCFCTGSLGVNPANKLPEMVTDFADRIHFVHLRNTTREPDGSFIEAEHLNGDTDMYAVMQALHSASRKRNLSLPMRPDHGHQILDDLRKDTNPGYAGIGRLKGLAELRGLAMGISRSK